MATAKGTVPSDVGAARPPRSENPGTYITAEELALLLQLLSQVLRKARGEMASFFLLPTNLLPKRHTESSINQVSIFLLLPIDQRKEVRSCFSKREHLLAEEDMTLLQTTHEM